jgi:glutamyl-tRNA reductase
MNIIALGMSHKTAPVEIREKYAIKEAGLQEALLKLKDIEEVLECMILSTCNRVELYALMLTADVEALADFLSRMGQHGGDHPAQLRPLLYSHINERALEHICRVSAGLDSMVVGEPQIFGQMKEAYNTAQQAGTTGSVFRSLFPQVFSLVKKIQTSTSVGRNTVSVSYAAVSLARKIFNNIQGQSVMIIGAGEMGELTVRNLMGQGAKRLYVTNRTFEKAVKIAEEFRGIPLMLYELSDYLPRVDIVISSISSEGYIINPADVMKAQNLRNGKPIILIDISVPRSVDPKSADIENVHLYNIDDLKSVVESALSLRAEEAEKANRLIGDKVQTILTQLKADDIEPTIAFLSSAAEEIRHREYETLMNSLALPEDQRGKVEAFSKSLVGQIVHQSIAKMREYVNTMKFK